MTRLKSIVPRIDLNPLTYRTLVYVLLCSTILALMATVVQLYTEYRRDLAKLNENIEIIERGYLNTIIANVYKIDQQGLKLQLDGALKIDGIVHLEVREQRGDRIIETAVGQLNAKKLIRYEYPLIYSDDVVTDRNFGTLTVSASLDNIYSRLLSRVLVVLATNGVKTFLASACILTIIYWMITRHLVQISEYTRLLHPGEQANRLLLKRKASVLTRDDELDQLVSAINELQERVNEAVAKYKAAQEQLQIAKEKYRTVADFTNDWEYWKRENGSLEYVSPSCELISGYAAHEFIKNPRLETEIVIPEDLEGWEQHSCEAHLAVQAEEVQFRIRRADGEIRWIEHNCRQVIDASGASLGIRAGNRDITKRKMIEIELRTAYADIEKLKNQLEEETRYLQSEIKLEHNFENIIGNSSALKYVLYKTEQVSAGDTTVLILGESGTGKELIARAIHSHSSRSKRTLIKINCAALPPHLIESELFGHERGAFTGAEARKLGRFEIADGSSIFLDEIGELPMELQAKLLRVLEDRELERLGGTKTFQVDVRVIAATNRDLEKEIRAGRFREDLFYRLNVFPITIPPLRQRIDDIPMLAQFFMQRTAKKLNSPVQKIPKRVLRKLQGYAWPGNVRELSNVVERAVINSSGTILQLMDTLPDSADRDNRSPLKSLAEVEKDHIVRMLKLTNWRIEGEKGAAVILQMNPSTLRSRIRKLNISKP